MLWKRNLHFVPLIIIQALWFVKRGTSGAFEEAVWYTRDGDTMKKLFVCLLALLVSCAGPVSQTAEEATPEQVMLIPTGEEMRDEMREARIKEAVAPIAAHYLEQGGGDVSYYLNAVDWDEPVVYNVHFMDPASVMKIYILARVTEGIADGSIDRNESYVMDAGNVAEGSGDLQFEPYGSSFTVGELVREMMRKSDNTATNMLIDVVGGIEEMHESVARWGLEDTLYGSKFVGPSVVIGPRYNQTSAADVGKLLTRIARGEFLGGAWDASIIEEMSHTENDTKIAARLPEGVTVAHKTGELEGLEHDAGILTTDADTYILVIFMDEGSNDDFIERIAGFSEDAMKKILEIEASEEE